MKLKEAKLQTIKKWKEIVTDIKKGGLGVSYTDCGFCDYMENVDIDRPCSECPVSHICGDYNQLYYQFTYARRRESSARLHIAQEILKEVKRIPVGLLDAVKRSLGRIYK